MIRAALVACLCCLSTTCQPFRELPDLTPLELLRQADDLLGREVVVRVEAGHYESGPAGVEVRTGKPDAPACVVFRGLVVQRTDRNLVVHGRVTEVTHDGIDRGAGRDGVTVRHCVALSACSEKVAVRIARSR